MKCSENIKLIQRYMDRELTGEEEAAMARHNEACSSCRCELRKVQRLSDVVFHFERAVAPEGFTEAVLAKLPARQVEKAGVPVFVQQILRPRVAYALLALLVLSLSLMFGDKLLLHGREGTITVRFEIQAPGAQTVSLAGDFNGWDMNATPLSDENHDGVWTIELPLKAGRVYKYMFVIDGSKWVPDPSARRSIDDGFGGKDSVLDLI